MKQVICLGSSHGSDRLGWDIAAALERRIAQQGCTGIRVRACASPAQLPALLGGTAALLIVDTLAGVPSGEVRLLVPEALERAPAFSSHGVDLVMALALARALGDLPAQVRIVGVGVGDPLRDAAPALEAVLPQVWTQLIDAFGA
jgi:hydrogenase maturation protease